ncbi:MAG: adenosylcobinamide-GDP ribazoletransferase [Rhodospirillales bacterium]|nr:adenosylcobinamide-GDP ribazoletransferase [Rhodospirillales bacterium]
MSVPRANPLQNLAAAFVLLTRIPLPWDRISNAPPDFNSSVWAFPVVGAVVGGFGAASYALSLTIGLPAIIAAILAIAATVILTGAFHEDGLADVADGFGGSTIERKLEIMRDSSIGSYGMIAIVLSMGLRIGGLSELNITQAMAALVAGGMLSRLMMTYVMRYMPPARKDGLAHDTGKPPFSRILIGTAFTIGVTVMVIGPLPALYATCIAIASCIIMAWIAKRQIGGFTGDVLGATQQVSDIAVLLFLVSFWG